MERPNPSTPPNRLLLKHCSKGSLPDTEIPRQDLSAGAIATRGVAHHSRSDIHKWLAIDMDLPDKVRRIDVVQTVSSAASTHSGSATGRCAGRRGIATVSAGLGVTCRRAAFNCSHAEDFCCGERGSECCGWLEFGLGLDRGDGGLWYRGRCCSGARDCDNGGYECGCDFDSGCSGDIELIVMFIVRVGIIWLVMRLRLGLGLPTLLPALLLAELGAFLVIVVVAFPAKAG